MSRANGAAATPPVSLSEAARALGRSRGTVARWIDAGCPAEGSPGARTVHLARVVQWLEARARQEEATRWRRRVEELERLAAIGPEAEADLPTQEWVRRKRRAEAKILELRAAEEEHRLIPLSDLAEAVEFVLRHTGARLTAIPSKIALALSAATQPTECHRIVEDEIEEVRLDTITEAREILEKEKANAPTK